MSEDRKFSNRIWNRGRLVQVSIGMWSMEAPLKARDVGLDGVKRDLIKLGHKKLLPTKQKNLFTKLRTKTSVILDSNGYKFLLRGAHYIPDRAFEDVMELLKEVQDEYNETADEFIQRYEHFRTNWIEENEEYADILLPYYPDPDTIREKFYYKFYYYKVKEHYSDEEYLESQLDDDDYEQWLAGSINDLRASVTEKVLGIKRSIQERGIDPRIYTRVRKVQDILKKLDMTNDESLQSAVDTMLSSPSESNADAVIKKANPLTTKQVVKLFI